MRQVEGKGERENEKRLWNFPQNLEVFMLWEGELKFRTGKNGRSRAPPSLNLLVVPEMRHFDFVRKSFMTRSFDFFRSRLASSTPSREFLSLTNSSKKKKKLDYVISVQINKIIFFFFFVLFLFFSSLNFPPSKIFCNELAKSDNDETTTDHYNNLL